jgi:hypothetical protein
MADLLSKEPPNLADLLGCARRELAMRQRVYPRLVSSRKMDQDKADLELMLQQQLCDLLEHLLAYRWTVDRLKRLGPGHD